MTAVDSPPNTSANKSKYNECGANYESRTYGAPHLVAYRDLRNRRIAREIDAHPAATQGLSILEVACGTGLVLEMLQGLSQKHRVTGLDISSVMLAQARDKFRSAETRPFLLTGSALALPFSNSSLDVIVATRFIHLFDHNIKCAIVREFNRVLKPSGIMIIEFYARPYHWVRYYMTPAAKGRSRASFLSHYPTHAQMREIMQGTVATVPIRLAGQKLFSRLLGTQVCNRLTAAMPLPGINPLIDEYLVVKRRS